MCIREILWQQSNINGTNKSAAILIRLPHFTIFAEVSSYFTALCWPCTLFCNALPSVIILHFIQY